MKGWLPWLLALASATLLPLGFPGFDLWPFAWIAFVPLLAIADRTTALRAALLGAVAGVLANVAGYGWLPRTIGIYAGLPWFGSWGLVLLLCAYQGLVFAFFAAVVACLRRARYPMVLAAPLAMVVIETMFPMVFPIFMGSSLHHQTWLIQAVDLFGPPVLTAVLVLGNVSIYLTVEAVIRRRRPEWRAVLAAPAVLALLLIYGGFRVAQVDQLAASCPSLRVGVVQPDLGMFEKWRDPWRALELHRQASRKIEGQGVDLIVWPEAAYVVEPIDSGADRVPDLVARDMGTPLLFGALTRETGDGTAIKYNSAIMADSSGRIVGTYQKVHLLSFSETLPGGRLLSWLYDLTPLDPGFRPGSGPRHLPLRVGGKVLRIAPLICFEDMLTGFARTAVNHTGANLMVNLTNDAWFGDSPAAQIHFTLAKFRAVENRRFLVRATNNGVSAVVDPCGRVAARLPAREPAQLVAEVGLLEGATVYGRVGNIFGYGSELVLLWFLWRSRRTGLNTAGKIRR